MLGGGQDGEVWRVNKTSLGRTFALKFLNNVDSDAKKLRFGREIQILKALHHQNIISLSDKGEARNPKSGDLVPYYVMEFLEAQAVDRLLARTTPQQNWNLITTCELFCQVTSAVAEIHKNNVSHGDIKPANVLVVPLGDPVAKLTDFGFGLRSGDPIDKREEYPSSSYRAPAGLSPKEADIYRLGRTIRDCIAAARLSDADTRRIEEELVTDLVERAPAVELDEIRFRLDRLRREAYRKPYHC